MQIESSKDLFISDFKRLAKANKRASGLTHSQCLDQLAEKSGYTNWSLMHKAIMRMPAPMFLLNESRLRQALGLPDRRAEDLDEDDVYFDDFYMGNWG